jgi:hypothetical protein
MESQGLPCPRGASCLLRICAPSLPMSIACVFQVLRRRRKMLILLARANPYLQPTAPVVMAKQERVAGWQLEPSLHRQQISTLRSLRENARGMF